MPESNGQKIQQDYQNPISVNAPLDTTEQEQLTFIIKRMESAKSQQEQKMHEFNGLDFLTDDQHNRDIRNSFIRPKKNDEEVRVNTGTVEKKMISVVNEILNLNMTAEVLSYDEQNKPVSELGDTFTNLLKKTEEQEDAQDLDFPALWDLATRRIMFLEEYQEEKECIDKRKIKYDLEKGDIQFETKKYKMSRPRKRLRDARSILLGDFSLPNNRYNEQPYIISYDRKHWRSAYSIYCNFKNWDKVRAGQPIADKAWFNGMFDFRLFPQMAEDEVEILTYYSYPDDEYQIIINGVPMLPPSTPLPWEYEGYSIQGFVSREMEQNLAVGQLFTINARVLAGISDEMLRLIIRKWRQSIEPPTAVKGKKVLSRDIWNPGASVTGMSKDDISKLIDNPGVTQSEMATFQMMSDKIEQEIGVSKLFQGQTDRKLTATQSIDQMKQAIKAIGLLVMSWAKVKRVMAYLRIYNIIENNTEPVDINYNDGEIEKVYKYYTVPDTKLDDNVNGTMVIQFSDKDMTPEEEQSLKDYEDSEQSKGNYVRYKQINVEKLRQFRMNWFVSVIPKEKDSSVLQKIMLTDDINQVQAIANLTGRRPNGQTIVNEYERIYKKKNMFEQIPSMPPVGPDGKPIQPSSVPLGVAEAAGSAGGPESVAMESQISSAIKREGVNSAV